MEIDINTIFDQDIDLGFTFEDKTPSTDTLLENYFIENNEAIENELFTNNFNPDYKLVLEDETGECFLISSNSESLNTQSSSYKLASTINPLNKTGIEDKVNLIENIHSIQTAFDQYETIASQNLDSTPNENLLIDFGYLFNFPNQENQMNLNLIEDQYLEVNQFENDDSFQIKFEEEKKINHKFLLEANLESNKWVNFLDEIINKDILEHENNQSLVNKQNDNRFDRENKLVILMS